MCWAQLREPLAVALGAPLVFDVAVAGGTRVKPTEALAVVVGAQRSGQANASIAASWSRVRDLAKNRRLRWDQRRHNVLRARERSTRVTAARANP